MNTGATGDHVYFSFLYSVAQDIGNIVLSTGAQPLAFEQLMGQKPKTPVSKPKHLSRLKN
jgi:hypothetical protein